MADEELLDQIDEILDNIDEFWAISVTDDLVGAVILAYTAGLADAATYIAELKGISVGVSFNVVDPEVIEFLKEHAAEMVRNINKGTRFYLRSMIYTGFQEGVGEEDLVKTILEGLFDVSDFSENRVRSIARFEIAKAQTKGWIKQLDEVGVKTKTWITIGPDACEVCKENEAMGPQPVNSKNYLTVFKGEKTDGPPAHPNVERCHLGIPANELDKMGMTVEWYTGKSEVTEKGGPGSGHHGHRGRKGKRGGSAPGKGARGVGIPSQIGLIKVGVEEGIKYNKDRLNKDTQNISDLMESYGSPVETTVNIVESTEGWLGTGDYTEGKITVDVAGKSVKASRLTLGEYQATGGGVYDTFRHEYGHHIFDKLPNLKKEEFNSLYSMPSRESNIWWHEISRLAERNNYEGFSEAFAVHTSPRYKPGKLPKPLEDYMSTIKQSVR